MHQAERLAELEKSSEYQDYIKAKAALGNLKAKLAEMQSELTFAPAALYALALTTAKDAYDHPPQYEVSCLNRLLKSDLTIEDFMKACVEENFYQLDQAIQKSSYKDSLDRLAFDVNTTLKGSLAYQVKNFLKAYEYSFDSAGEENSVRTHIHTILNLEPGVFSFERHGSNQTIQEAIPMLVNAIETCYQGNNKLDAFFDNLKICLPTFCISYSTGSDGTVTERNIDISPDRVRETYLKYQKEHEEKQPNPDKCEYYEKQKKFAEGFIKTKIQERIGNLSDGIASRQAAISKKEQASPLNNILQEITVLKQSIEEESLQHDQPKLLQGDLSLTAVSSSVSNAL